MAHCVNNGANNDVILKLVTGAFAGTGGKEF